MLPYCIQAERTFLGVLLEKTFASHFSHTFVQRFVQA